MFRLPRCQLLNGKNIKLKYDAKKHILRHLRVIFVLGEFLYYFHKIGSIYLKKKATLLCEVYVYVPYLNAIFKHLIKIQIGE